MSWTTMPVRYKTRGVQIGGIAIAILLIWSAFIATTGKQQDQVTQVKKSNHLAAFRRQLGAHSEEGNHIVRERQLWPKSKTLRTNLKMGVHSTVRPKPPQQVTDAPIRVPKDPPQPNSVQARPGLNKPLWIVLTTIQSPTEQVKALAKIPGWQIVVVADTKTPIPWSCEGAIFLSIEDQKKLGYSIHDIIPYKNYARKNIGYLFAIQHGATYIYETDDDNVPTVPLETFFMSPNKTTGLVVNTDRISYNPCPHFGQSSLWPRGYPLERIGITETHEYTISEIGTPPVQQGFVDGDPDLDAIYRLTRKHTSERLDLTFDKAAPPVVLPVGTFAPMNSQNTLFTTKALWALMLPITVTMRVTDIYRAYWYERLLWLYGERIAFFPPNAYQERSPHSYLKDAKDEVEMYHHTEELLMHLKSWQCNARSLPECAAQLSQEMADKKFWGQADADMTVAWLKDLKAVGYEAPPLPAQLSSNTGLQLTTFYANEQNTSWAYSPKKFFMRGLTNVPEMEIYIRKFCYIPSSINYEEMRVTPKRHADTVLIIGITRLEDLPILDAYNKQIVPNTIFCSSLSDSQFFNKWKLSHVHVKGSPTAFSCLRAASRMRHLVTGYLYVPPNTLLEAKSMIATHLSQITYVNENTLPPQNTQQNPTIQQTLQKLSDALQNKQQSECFLKGASTAAPPADGPVYIPRAIADNLSALDAILSSVSDHPYFSLMLSCILPKVNRFIAVPLSDLSRHDLGHYISFNKYSGKNDQTDVAYKRLLCSPFQVRQK